MPVFSIYFFIGTKNLNKQRSLSCEETRSSLSKQARQNADTACGFVARPSLHPMYVLYLDKPR